MSDHDNDDCPHLVRASLLESENARLKAEVEHLGAFRTHTIIPNEILKAENARLKAEVDALKLGSLLTAVDVLQFINLKAEVERLRASSFVTAVPVEQYERVIKAGDAMEREICILGPVDDKEIKAIEAWNAAKEGKPTV